MVICSIIIIDPNLEYGCERTTTSACVNLSLFKYIYLPELLQQFDSRLNTSSSFFSMLPTSRFGVNLVACTIAPWIAGVMATFPVTGTSVQ